MWFEGATYLRLDPRLFSVFVISRVFGVIFLTIGVCSATLAEDLQIRISDLEFSFSEISFSEDDSIFEEFSSNTKGGMAFDIAYNTTNPDYRISDSPYMRLTDIDDWMPIIPPESRRVETVNGPTAVEIYDVATGDTTTIPIDGVVQEDGETGDRKSVV